MRRRGMCLHYPREAWPTYWEHEVRLCNAPWWAWRQRRRERRWLGRNRPYAAYHEWEWLGGAQAPTWADVDAVTRPGA